VYVCLCVCVVCVVCICAVCMSLGVCVYLSVIFATLAWRESEVRVEELDTK